MSVALTAAAQTEGAHERQGRGIRSTGTDSMSVALIAAAQTEGMQKGQGKGKTNPAGWFSMSALGAQGNCATCGSRFETRVWLIPAQAGIKRGFRALALILSAHSAGTRIVTYGPERDSGRCPENPQAF